MDVFRREEICDKDNETSTKGGKEFIHIEKLHPFTRLHALSNSLTDKILNQPLKTMHLVSCHRHCPTFLLFHLRIQLQCHQIF